MDEQKLDNTIADMIAAAQSNSLDAEGDIEGTAEPYWNDEDIAVSPPNTDGNNMLGNNVVDFPGTQPPNEAPPQQPQPQQPQQQKPDPQQQEGGWQNTNYITPEPPAAADAEQMGGDQISGDDEFDMTGVYKTPNPEEYQADMRLSPVLQELESLQQAVDAASKEKATYASWVKTDLLTNPNYRDASHESYLEPHEYQHHALGFQHLQLIDQKIAISQDKFERLKNTLQDNMINVVWEKVAASDKDMAAFLNPQTRPIEINKIHSNIAKVYGLQMQHLASYQDPSTISMMRDALAYRKGRKAGGKAPQIPNTKMVSPESLHTGAMGGQGGRDQSAKSPLAIFQEKIRKGELQPGVDTATAFMNAQEQWLAQQRASGAG